MWRNSTEWLSMFLFVHCADNTCERRAVVNLEARNKPAAGVSFAPNYVQTMPAKSCNIMTPTFSRSDVETSALHTNLNHKQSTTEESGCFEFEVPLVSRSFNGSEATSHLWPAWQNYSSHEFMAKLLPLRRTVLSKTIVQAVLLLLPGQLVVE